MTVMSGFSFASLYVYPDARRSIVNKLSSKRSYGRVTRTSMFSAALEIEYEAFCTPRSEPTLPSVLEIFTMVFFVLFSTRPMNA